MKKKPLKITNKLYFIPLIYGIGFFLLSVITSHFTLNLLPFLFTDQVFLSQFFLTLIGGLLTMLTITFSTMMVVLTLYSNQLSPRTLQDFLKNRTTTHVLGFFIGGLVYTSSALFFSQRYNGMESVVPFIGVLIFLISLALFAYFIYFVAKEVQVNHYIQRIEKQIERMIDTALEESIDFDTIGEHELESLELNEKDKIIFKADTAGYIANYNIKGLLDYAEEHQLLIETIPFLGNYVSKGDVLLHVYGEGSSDMLEDLKPMISLEDEPNTKEDIDSNIKKITEVAVKALSPGYNDPNTAIFCISRIAYLLKKESRIIETRKYTNDKDDIILLYSNKSFDQALMHNYAQILYYGGHDLYVFIALIKACNMIARQNTYEIRVAVKDFATYILQGPYYDSFQEYEKSTIQSFIQTLADTLNVSVKKLTTKPGENA